MGLTVWKGAIVRKQDSAVAKNYLKETEIDELNRIVVMWLDFAEDQAKRRKQVFLEDWQGKLDEFLRFNDRAVLPDSGAVSKQDTGAHAALQYERFEQRRRAAREAAGAADTIDHLEDLGKTGRPSEQ